MKQQLYYIQNGCVGNAMYWWRAGDCGYTENIYEAGKYTKEEAESRCKDDSKGYRPWLCDYVDAQMNTAKGQVEYVPMLILSGKCAGIKTDVQIAGLPEFVSATSFAVVRDVKTELTDTQKVNAALLDIIDEKQLAIVAELIDRSHQFGAPFANVHHTRKAKEFRLAEIMQWIKEQKLNA